MAGIVSLLAACASGTATADGSAADDESGSIDTTTEAVLSDRVPRPAPPMALSAAETTLFAPLPVRADAIPVVLFHGICPEACPTDDLYFLPRAQFIRIMLMIVAAGYRTITPGQYVKFMRGDKRGLPAKPLLLTFDDGHASAYLEGDAVLAGLGLRATMFVITDRPEHKDDSAVRWTEWRTAAATGRWSVQLHANEGHVTIPAGVDGSGVVDEEPFYAVRRYDAEAYPTGDHLESFDAWKVRAAADLDSGSALMTARLHNAYQPLLFAVPFGDYGQRRSNDPAILAALSEMLDTRFAFWFTQVGNADFTKPGAGTHERNRYTVLNTTKAEAVYSWLKKHAVLTNP